MLDVFEFSSVEEDDFDDFGFDGEHLELESEIGAYDPDEEEDDEMTDEIVAPVTETPVPAPAPAPACQSVPAFRPR